MKKNIRSRKGVSLVEVVVALAVITIISISALSVVFMSVKVEAKTVVVFEVRNSAENAIECFRFADGDEEIFRNCLNATVASGQQFAGENGTYVSNAGNYTVTITMLPEESGFTYRAVNEAGQEIYSFTFKNGGEQE